MKFNNQFIRTVADDMFHRTDVAKAINYGQPYSFGYNQYGAVEYLHWEDLKPLLCRCRYPKAKELLEYIRQTMEYKVPAKPTMAFITQEYEHAKNLAKLCGRTEEAAIEAANNAIRNTMGVDVLHELLMATTTVTTEDIGKTVNLPKEKVNRWLILLNYQTEDFKPTLKGQAFAAFRNGQVAWHPSIISEMRELLPQ